MSEVTKTRAILRAECRDAIDLDPDNGAVVRREDAAQRGEINVIGTSRSEVGKPQGATKLITWHLPFHCAVDLSAGVVIDRLTREILQLHVGEW